MAQCKFTPHEFIQNAFSPMIACLCSPLAEQICQKNNLSFTEMLQPFCKLNTEAHYRDPSGNVIAVRNLRIGLFDVNSRPPQPTLARKLLNECVSSCVSDRLVPIQNGNQTIEIPASAPWFESWRETFLQVQFPSDHEFTKHYIGCILVISSSEGNPMDILQQMGLQLQQMQNVGPAKLPKWFSSVILKYYVLIHDINDGNNEKVETVFELMKNTYGIHNCYLLLINSRALSQNEDVHHLPDPWSQFLTRHVENQDASDHDSSPRTPAEVGSVTTMPSHLSTDSCTDVDGEIPTKNLAGPILLSSLEEAQEVGEGSSMTVTHHPLSPEADARLTFINSEKNSISTAESNSFPKHVNVNVWAGHNHQFKETQNGQHGICLSSQDLDHIRMLVHEFCLKALLPFVERQIQQLSDYISNKKGMSKSIFSATKRWFGSTKPGAPSMSSINAVIYASDAPELQLRRLGDLCFMFGNYTLAFQAYHSAKRDFNADQAWLYYAGALEMAALSAFMQGGEPMRKAQEYMEESIVTYLNSCKMPQFATRATLLSTECLKGRNYFAESAKQFIRMTSEDSDLRSALLLEQASYCFLKSRPQMSRKYAFHIVLAGHRFSKAGQRKHSLRCYKQAFQVYEEKDWSLAEDHIQFTIGRQASNLKQISDAAKAFSRLLTPASKQSAVQQAVFLKEYLIIQQKIQNESDNANSGLHALPLPLVDSNVKVLLGPVPPKYDVDKTSLLPASGVSFKSDRDDNKWTKLEELLVATAQGYLPITFKPSVQLYSDNTINSSKPIGIVGEPITVSVMIQNPLRIPIPLKDLHLLWTFSVDNVQICNESNSVNHESYAMTQNLDSIELQPESVKEITLSITVWNVGDLHIKGLAYELSNSVTNGDIENSENSGSSISVQGKIIFQLKMIQKKLPKDKSTQEILDKRLEISVYPSAPCLQVKFQDLQSEMLCGEMQLITIHFSNVGNAELTNIYIVSSTPDILSFGDALDTGLVFKINLPEELNNCLLPGQISTVPMWIRAPDEAGPTCIELLFYYENADSSQIPRYRLVRHSWKITVLESVAVTVTPVRSSASSISDSEQTLNLTVEVKNTNQAQNFVTTELTLSQISLASKLWKINDTIKIPEEINLHSEELVHLALKLNKTVNKDSEYLFSDLSLEKTKEVKSLSNNPYLNYYNKFMNKLNKKVKNFNTSNNIPNLKEESYVDHMEAALNVEAAVILRWKAWVTSDDNKKRIAIGQHHVLLDKIGITANSHPISNSALHQESDSIKIFGPDVPIINLSPEKYPSLDVLQKLVIYSIHHPPKLVHNFSLKRLCLVPVQLQLQNCSNCDLIIKVDGQEMSSSAVNKSQLYSPHASRTFHWIGLVSTNLDINPYGNAVVSLTAAVANPGTYDLATHLQIWCRVKTAPETDSIAQAWHVESSLVISSGT